MTLGGENDIGFGFVFNFLSGSGGKLCALTVIVSGFFVIFVKLVGCVCLFGFISFTNNYLLNCVRRKSRVCLSLFTLFALFSLHPDRASRDL